MVTKCHFHLNGNTFDRWKNKQQKNNKMDLKQLTIDTYARNLNDLASSGKLDPVIGRDDEIRRVLQILSRRTKNNPILIGEPGVGKTAIAEGLAQRILEGNVPDILSGNIIFSLDMASLVSGTKFRGSMEERLKKAINKKLQPFENHLITNNFIFTKIIIFAH